VATFEDYANAFETIAFERRDGILQLSVHTGGGSLKWGGTVHRELPDAFYAVGTDPDNDVVIVTGTGDVFCEEIDYTTVGDVHSFEVTDAILREGKQLLGRLLDIDVPVVGAINGPARIHAEIPLLGDVVLASEHAVLQDAVHFERGVVPGDGVHTLWPMWLGPNRGRAFLMTGQEIGAEEALALGLVAEVVPHAQLLERAWAVARRIAERPKFARRYTRQVLTLGLKRALTAELAEGLALESLARLSVPKGSYPPIRDNIAGAPPGQEP
jgi:enoyl-CoA hydratase/carnithine racemase